MSDVVTCECGQPFPVTARDAGSTFVCHCGRDVRIPRVAYTPGSAPRDGENSANRPAIAILVATFIVAAISATQSPGALFPVGLLMIFIGRVWLAALVLRELDLPNAMMVLLVPFMPTVFLFKRFDIAGLPFAYSVLGVFVAMSGFDSL